MSERALGLMSGTSVDGISMCLAEIDLDRGRLRVEASSTTPYPARLRRAILGAKTLQTDGLAALSFELGRFWAAAASKFLSKQGVRPISVSVVGSHGQTVAHDPARGYTLQIGEPSFLAETLGVPVVCDFRPADIAAGGQGAPIVPFFDRFLFAAQTPIVLQNIGGVANATLLHGDDALAFDTGPGNSLIDLTTAAATKGRLQFDRGGRLAAIGNADRVLIKKLLALPYFRARPPKSLDRGEFGADFMRRHFGALLRRCPEDAVATATWLTAESMRDAYERFVYPVARPNRVVVSGGGALNATLMKNLTAVLAPLTVASIEDEPIGMSALAKEPAAMALLALCCLKRRVNHLPGATGARGSRILGKITWPK